MGMVVASCGTRIEFNGQPGNQESEAIPPSAWSATAPRPSSKEEVVARCDTRGDVAAQIAPVHVLGIVDPSVVRSRPDSPPSW